MFEFIDKIKDKYRQNRVEKLLNVQKSLSEIEDRIEELSKAQPHKYIRKEPDGKGGFNYIYDEPEISKEQRDKNFKEWFGDSKVVDENGKPLVVYHGTEADFSEFKDKSSAYYFSENPSYAEKYSKNNGSIMPCYLKSIHLKNVDFEINHFNVDKYLNSFEYAMSDIDGLVGIDAGTKQKVYVVFNQNQIKSAIGNKGTFDKNSNDITKSINSYISELAQLKLNKNKLLKSEKSLQNEDPLFKSMYDHMRFDSTYREVTKAYRQGDISLDKCDEILKAINNDKKVKYSDNLVFNTEGKLLLLKRSELDKTFPGMYTIPGGHVDAGEDHRTAAIRELQEESGLTPDKDTQFQKIGEYEDDKCCIEYFRSNVDKDNDTLTLQSEEAWQYEWIDPRELDKYEFPLNMKQNIQKILFPQKEVIQKLGKALRNKEITKSQFIQLCKAINHKYIDKKLNKFGNFYYIYKENENSFNDGKEKENSTRIIEDSGTTIISNSIQGSPEEYKGERKASWQLNKLREEAEKKGFLEDELQNLKIQSEKVLRGTEAQVLFVKSDDDNMDVLKAFDPISHLSPKETLDDFVDRINLYNEYFSETPLYFRGLSNDKSKITILFSQKYVDGNVLKLPDPPAFESFNEAKIRLKEEDKLYKQVALELKKRYGFTPVGKEKTKYTNGKVTIQDVHLGNVMKGTDGKLYFIDLDISKNEDAIQKLGKAYKSGKITREKFMQAANVLSKSQGHKYIRKEFSTKGTNYIYEESKDISNKTEKDTNEFIDTLGKYGLKRGKHFNISVSKTDYGNSNYVKFYDKNFRPIVTVRVSDHSVGVKRHGDEYSYQVLKESNEIDNFIKDVLTWYKDEELDKSLSRNYEELLKKQKKRRDPEGIEDKQYTKEEAEYVDNFQEGTHQEENSCDRCEYYQPKQKDNCLKVIGEVSHNGHCKFLEHTETQKSLQSIDELYLQNRISDELYEKIIEKAWKKSPIGTITTRSNGQKWKKVSETGNKDQDWQLVSKPRTGNKTDSPVSKEKRAEYGTKGKQPTISEAAKNASETALNAAIKESQDPEVREAAHQELDRRQKEEHVQEEEKKDGGEKKDTLSKEDKDVLKLKGLGLDLVREDVRDEIEAKSEFKREESIINELAVKLGVDRAIAAYKATKKYSSSTYGRMNNSLRSDKLPKDVDLIDDFIENAPKNKSNILFRGVDRSFGEKLEVGQSFTDKAFSSTSEDKETAMNFANKKSKGFIIEISGTKDKGSNMPLSHYTKWNESEQEVMLPRNTSYKVEDIKDNIIKVSLIDDTKEVKKSESTDQIKGGMSDNKSLKEIAQKHDVDIDDIIKELELGIKVEMEHTDDPKVAIEIAKDHLCEFPTYYTELDKMEQSLKDKEKAK